MDAAQRYRNAVSHALAGFQLVEEGLKDYLGFYYATVRRLLPDELAFGYARDDIKDAALGKLINVSSKVCSNTALIAELRTLIKVRDDLAHRALIDLYGNGAQTQDLELKTKALFQTAERINTLLKQVNEESLKVLSVATPSPGAGQAEA